MALANFLRTPFLPVEGSTAAHYTLPEDLVTRLRVNVDGAAPARLKLQPVFPGTLTFKHLPNQTVPEDPSTSGTIRGHLFLEISPKGQQAIAAAASHLSYGLIFAYLDVTLDSEFFNKVALASLRTASGTLKRVTVGGLPLTNAKQLSNAFARGDLSVSIDPTSATLRMAFPRLSMASPATSGQATFILFTRPRWNRHAAAPPLTELTSEQILAVADVVPIPVAYFYRALSRLSTWSTLAASDHVNHPLLAAITNSERVQDSPPQFARWRRLHIGAVDSAATTQFPGTTAFEDMMATARTREGSLPGGGVELWTESLNLLGELFVRRLDNEEFRLTAREQGGAFVKLRHTPSGPDEDFLDLTWAPPSSSNAEPPRLDVSAKLLDGDPLAEPFTAIPYGSYDEGGVTYLAENVAGRTTHRVISRRALVKPLQRLLRTFGFAITNESGRFERPLSQALRELQCYAAMEHVAVEGEQGRHYADRLTSIPNLAPYQGQITGIFDAATATAMRHWRLGSLRCPVVVERWLAHNGQRETMESPNIWSPREGAGLNQFMFVRDVSGHYAIPPSRIPQQFPIPVPDFGRVSLGEYIGTNGNGPRCVANSTWREDLPNDDSDSNVTPLRLVGRVLPANPAPPHPDAAAASTCKVVDAVSSVETGLLFDAINGYDGQVISMGLYHWTLVGGELSAYLSLLAAREDDEYEHYFGRFGMSPLHPWTAPPRDNALYNMQGKWVSQVQQRGLPQRINGNNVANPALQPVPTNPPEDIAYLHSWHWLYRWVMASRLSPAFRRRQWDLARLRLREVLDARWGAPHPTFQFVRDAYSSERLVTMLLRAHVNAPSRVIVAQAASATDPTLVPTANARLRNAFADSGINAAAANWTDAQMAALEGALLTRLAPPNTTNAIDQILRDTIPRALAFDDPSFDPLRNGRGTFHLDDAGLDQA